MNQTVTAYQKFIRQSPRKVRLVADAIRNMKVDEALNQLTVTHKRAAGVLKKVLIQAKSNAVNNKQLVENSLKIHEILIEEGPTLKRWQPVSRGRAHPILKRSSHIKVTVKGSEQSTAAPARKE